MSLPRGESEDRRLAVKFKIAQTHHMSVCFGKRSCEKTQCFPTLEEQWSVIS